MSSRGQYNAMTLIKLLNSNHSDKTLKVIGLTEKDISNPILTHVFGEAYMGGSAAVMSCARLRANPKGELVNRDHFLDRVVKVAIHEIGHTFNIPHCHHGRCVMRVSNGLQELDDKLNYLCDYCELFLAEAVTAALKDIEKDGRRIETA
jgi:archaemetzincin